MRAYISGPISGIPEANEPAFRACAERTARRLMMETLVPHDIKPFEHKGDCAKGSYASGEPGSHQACCYLRTDVAALAACDAIVMMPGWRASRGAMLEFTNAVFFGMEIWFYNEAANDFGRIPS